MQSSYWHPKRSAHFPNYTTITITMTTISHTFQYKKNSGHLSNKSDNDLEETRTVRIVILTVTFSAVSCQVSHWWVLKGDTCMQSINVQTNHANESMVAEVSENVWCVSDWYSLVIVKPLWLLGIQCLNSKFSKFPQLTSIAMCYCLFWTVCALWLAEAFAATYTQGDTANPDFSHLILSVCVSFNRAKYVNQSNLHVIYRQIMPYSWRAS